MNSIKIYCLIITTLLSTNLFSQTGNRTEIQIPDILGYTTLKCDFHMHTVFSDGKVWPTIRVQEAWLEGLDAISITDHIEYLPYKDDVNIDKNRSYEIALKEASKYGIIVIQGAEITRSYPYGHNNTLYIKDANKLVADDAFDAFKEAKNQSAFIFWNHPGLWRENNIPIWTDKQAKLLENKMMHGIEIVNNNFYYPLAHKWAIENNLTLLGNSDVHDPIAMSTDLLNSHRAMTLVFVDDKTEKGIRDALENKRTVVYLQDTLIGDVKYLKEIFNKSLTITNTNLKMKENFMWQFIQLHNSSDIPFHLKRSTEVDSTIGLASDIYIPAHKTVLMTVKAFDGVKEGKQNLKVKYLVENFFIAPGEGLPIDIEFSIEYTDIKE